MEIMIENYSIDEHIHRYACRIAARAASISRFSNKGICQFIEEIHLRNELEKLCEQQIKSEVYKEKVIRQVENIFWEDESYKSRYPKTILVLIKEEISVTEM